MKIKVIDLKVGDYIQIRDCMKDVYVEITDIHLFIGVIYVKYTLSSGVIVTRDFDTDASVEATIKVT
jgi:hypothetical protein